MPAPTYGDQYLQIAPPLTGNPPTAAESTPALDPNFEIAWGQSKYRCPEDFEGDYAFKIWCATLAYRYAAASASFVPAISGISPTTGSKLTNTTITITGTKFDAGAMPVFNGKDYTPTTRTLTSIVFSVPAADIPIAGTYGVQVRNTDGATTAATNFTAT